MFQRLSGFVFKYIIQTVLIAWLYVLTARAGFLIALPPGNVTALWPPSGIALAAGLILGYHVGIGVWLGSFIVNLASLNGAAAPATAAMIATGSTLQMLLGIFLVRRFVVQRLLQNRISEHDIIAPTTPRGILIFIAVTALSALVAPSIGVTSLCLAGFAARNNFFTLWLTWWFGDYAGILTLAPTLMVVTLWLRKQATAEPIFFPLATVWLGLSLIAFSFLWHFEEQSLIARLRVDTNQITRDIQQVIAQDIQRLVAVNALYAASHEIDRSEFSTFTKLLLRDNPTVQTLAWVPRISQAERAVYEQAARQDGFSDYQILERDVAGKQVVAGQRAEYFPIYFLEPYAGNETAMGFDLASDPLRLRAIINARDTGKLAMTAPLSLVQGPGQQKATPILIPVYRPGALVNSVETRRANLLGVVSGVFRVGNIVQIALRNGSAANIELYLFDTTFTDAQFLNFYSCSGEINTPAVSDNLKPVDVLTGFYTSTSFNVAQRKWQAIIRACPAYIAGGRGPGPWAILLIGLSLSGIVLAYTEIRQRSEAALRESESTTRLIIDTALDAIVAADDTGRIIFANLQAEVVFGYSREELLGMPVENLLPERFRQKHKTHRLHYSAQPTQRKMSVNLALYGLRKDGSEFPVEVMLNPVETSQGRLSMATIRDISELKRVESAMAESEQTYRALFEHANDAIFLLSLDGVNQQVNQKAADLLGYTRDELVGMSTYDIIIPAEYADAKDKLNTLLAGHILPPYERLLHKSDGKLLPVEINLSLVRDLDDRPKYIQSIVRDITERKNALEQIRQLNASLEHRVAERTTELQKEISERKRIEAALQLSHDQLHHFVDELEKRNREVTMLGALTEILESCNDASEAYQAVSQHLPRLFPKDAGVLYMISDSRTHVNGVAQWGKLSMGAGEAVFTSMDCWALRRGREHTTESASSDMLCKHVSHTLPLPLPCSCVPMVAHGEILGILHIRYTLDEGEILSPTRKQLTSTVAEQLALVLANLNLRETLRNQSIRDGLTGLFNRRYMEEAVARELRRAERGARPLAVAMFDIDHFKHFNDTFGHAAGDAALRALSDLLRTSMRAGDIVCRYGGEEFVIIFIEMTLENAAHRMEGLRENVKQLNIEYLGRPLGQLTVSVGVAAFPEYGMDPDTLLKAADDALYRAKQTGRDRVAIIPIEPES